jgi:hypothetical protein
MGISSSQVKNESTNYLMKTRRDASVFEKQAGVAAGFALSRGAESNMQNGERHVTDGQIA